MKIHTMISYLLSMQLWISSITGILILIPTTSFATYSYEETQERIDSAKTYNADSSKSENKNGISNDESVENIIFKNDIISYIKKMTSYSNKIFFIKKTLVNDIYKNRKQDMYFAKLKYNQSRLSLESLMDEAISLKNMIIPFIQSENQTENFFISSGPMSELKNNMLYDYLKLKVLNLYLNLVVRDFRELYIIYTTQENAQRSDMTILDQLLPEFELGTLLEEYRIAKMINGQSKTQIESNNLDLKTKNKRSKRNSRYGKVKRQNNKEAKTSISLAFKYTQDQLLNSLYMKEIIPIGYRKEKMINLLGEEINSESNILFNLRKVEEDTEKYQIYFDLERPIINDVKSLGRINTAFSYLTSMKWLTAIKIKNEIKKYSHFYPNDKTEIQIPNSCHFENGGHFPETLPKEAISEHESDILLSEYLHSNGLVLDERFIREQLYNSCLDQQEVTHTKAQAISSCNKTYEEIEGLSFISNIDANDNFNKVMPEDLRDLFSSNYLLADSASPESGGFLGTLPFETYQFAKKALPLLKGERGYEIGLDDVTSFTKTIEIKKSQIQTFFSEKDTRTRRTKIADSMSSKKYSPLEDSKKLKKVILDALDVKFIAENTQVNEKEDEIAALLASFGAGQAAASGPQIYTTPLLFNLYKKDENTAFHWEDILSSSQMNKIKSQKLKIKFPPYLSSNLWKSWSIPRLKEALIDYQEKHSIYLTKTIAYACIGHDQKIDLDAYRKFYGHEYKVDGYGFKEYCKNNVLDKKGKLFAKAVINKLIKFLSYFSDEGIYLPNISLTDKKLEIVYPLLRVIWFELSSKNDILKENSHIKYYDYLLESINDSNPFAILKISLMKLKKVAKESVSSKYWNRTGERITQKVLDILKADEKLVPNFANTILSTEEKKAVFSAMKDEVDEKSHYLFTLPLEGETLEVKRRLLHSRAVNIDNEAYIKTQYNAVHAITSSEIVSESSYKKIMSDLDLTATKIDQKRVNEVFANSEFMKANAFEAVKNSRDESEETQAAILENLYISFPKLKEATLDFKTTYFNNDQFLKSVVLKALIRKIAKRKVKELYGLFENLCDKNTSIQDRSHWTVFGLFGDNIEEVRSLYSISKKSQDELENTFKIKAPKMLEEYASAQSDEETQAMKDGMMSAVWIGAGVAFGAICGLAAAATAGAALLTCMLGVGPLAALSAVGYGSWLQVSAVKLERKDLVNKGNAQIELTRYYHHGLLDRSTVESLDKGPFAMGLEMAFTIPVLGAFGRALYVGTKGAKLAVKVMAKQSRIVLSKSKSISKRHTLKSLRAAYLSEAPILKKIRRESMIKMQATNKEYQLMKSLEISGHRKWDPATETKAWFKEDKIDMTDVTEASIKKGLAKQYARSLGNSKGLKKRYTKYLNKMKKWKNSASNTHNTESLVKRMEKRIAHESKIEKMVKELDRFNPNDTKALEAFIERNLPDMVQVTNDMPAGLGMLYYMLAQGSFILLKRLPIHGRIAEYAVMKRFAAAYDTLISEVLVREIDSMAEQTTKLMVKVGRDVTDLPRSMRMLHKLAGPLEEMMGGIEYAIKNTVNKKDKRVLIDLYVDYQKDVSNKVSSFVQGHYNTKKLGQKIKSKLSKKYKVNWELARNMTPKDAKKLIFSRDLSPGDEALRDFVLNSIDPALFVNADVFDQLSFIARQQLKDMIASSPNAFQKSLAILNGKVLKRNPITIEFF